MRKNYFQFYETFFVAINTLPEKERLRFYDVVIRYGLFGELPVFEDEKDNAIFVQIQYLIDNQNNRRAINRDNVNKRWEKIQNDTNGYETIQNVEMNRNEMKRNELNLSGSTNQSGISYEKTKTKKTPSFQKPTLDEVAAYCRERNNFIDPQVFIDYYDCNGWMVGKNRMKDWKAAVRTWERRNKRFNYSKNNNGLPDIDRGDDGSKWNIPEPGY